MKPVKKIALIIICTFLLMEVAGLIADKGYKKYYQPYFEKMEHLFKDSSYNDILYFGNSRANFGINPYFIDSICNTKSYNLGFGGTDIATSVDLLKSYLIHHRAPSLLVYNYDYRIFKLRAYLELAPVYFYYARYEPIRHILASYGYHEKLLQYLPVLKYSFFNDYYRTCIIKGLQGHSMNSLKVPVEKHLYDHRGFLNFQLGNTVSEKPDTSVPAINGACIEKLNELVDMCHQNNMRLVFIYPPEYYTSPDVSGIEFQKRKRSIDSMIISVAQKNNFFYKRFDTGEFLEEDFADRIHVNIPGSKKFSIMLGDYIKTIFK
jgi:hypothetical protein